MTRKPTQDVIDQFAQNPDCPDLNSHGNVRVRFGTLYSYYTAVATWAEDDDTGDPVLVVDAQWDGHSHTTSTHMGYLYEAVVGDPGQYAYGECHHEQGYDHAKIRIPHAVRVQGDPAELKGRWADLQQDGGGSASTGESERKQETEA